MSGIDSYRPDLFVAPSNFVRNVARRDFGIFGARALVVFNGVERSWYSRAAFFRRRRETFRLLYVGHPTKGLEAACSILRLLRRQDLRFELHVFGGNSLWGMEDERREPEDGIVAHGVVGQRALAAELCRGGFAISLQTVPEAFGIAVAEAMAAGTIVLVSPVGAFPEYVRDGDNGFLVGGDPAHAETHARAVAVMLDLVRRPNRARRVRRRARATPLDWTTVARAWQGYWDWMLGHGARLHRERRLGPGRCAECGERLLHLVDGNHCTGCGAFSLASAAPS